MPNAKDFRRIVLGLEGTTESAHMGHPDFRANGRIFVTLQHDPTWGGLMLTPDQQRLLLDEYPDAFKPAAGAWGRAGSTLVHLPSVSEDVLGSGDAGVAEQQHEGHEERHEEERKEHEAEEEREEGETMKVLLQTAFAGFVTLCAASGFAASPPVPMVAGPVTMPGLMYPNPAVSIVPAAAKVEDFPYVTEEYFVSGTANGAPYATRIIIRRPTDAKVFSGTVAGEAMHAGGRSLIFEWSRVSILTRHHLFAEIVHSPAQIQMLKTFNAERYASLSIAMGQSNEIIAQFGRLMKNGMTSGSGPLAAYNVRRVTLMGTSASSATVRNYLGVHADLRMPDGGPIFDGFLLTSTLGNTPLPIVDVPIVQMPTQTEVTMYAEQGNGYRRPDSDAPGNRFRLYEVAGMPHNNSRENPGFLNDPCTLPVTDFPAGAFTALGLNYLVEWIANGKTPPHAPPIAVDKDTTGDGSLLALDEYSNAKGGIRNVFVDVPIAANGVLGKGKTPAQDRLCQLGGTKVMLPHDTLAKLYKSSSDYQDRVNERLNALIKEGWFLPEYADAVRADAKLARIP